MKIIAVKDNNSELYVNHVINRLAAEGYSAEGISINDLALNYNKEATAPTFFIEQNNKVAYMLPGKRDINTILKWVKDSNIL